MTVTVPNDTTPTDVEAKAALGEALRLIGKLMFVDADHVEALDAAPPAPLFSLLGMLAADAWPLGDAPLAAPQRRALAGLLTLIDMAADMALDICERKPIGDASRIIAAGNVLAGGSGADRHVLRMTVDCLRAGRRECRTAVNDDERAGSLAQVMAELPVILQRDPVSGGEAVVKQFLDVEPNGSSDGEFFSAVSVLLEKAFGFRASAKSIDNATQSRGKERLAKG